MNKTVLTLLFTLLFSFSGFSQWQALSFDAKGDIPSHITYLYSTPDGSISFADFDSIVGIILDESESFYGYPTRDGYKIEVTVEFCNSISISDPLFVQFISEDKNSNIAVCPNRGLSRHIIYYLNSTGDVIFTFKKKNKDIVQLVVKKKIFN